jgi:hypothetical protein
MLGPHGIITGRSDKEFLREVEAIYDDIIDVDQLRDMVFLAGLPDDERNRVLTHRERHTTERASADSRTAGGQPLSHVALLGKVAGLCCPTARPPTPVFPPLFFAASWRHELACRHRRETPVRPRA